MSQWLNDSMAQFSGSNSVQSYAFEKLRHLATGVGQALPLQADFEGGRLAVPIVLERQTPLRSVRLRAIITDSHFWAPAIVLVLGVLLLVYLH